MLNVMQLVPRREEHALTGHAHGLAGALPARLVNGALLSLAAVIANMMELLRHFASAHLQFQRLPKVGMILQTAPQAMAGLAM